MGWARLDWQIPAKNYESRYEANEIAADNDFKGKKILVAGVVASINKGLTDDGYVVFRGTGFMGVHAKLSDQGAVEAATFSKGHEVALVCTGGGYVMSIAILEDCAASEEYLNTLPPAIMTRVTQFLNGSFQLQKASAAVVATTYATGLNLSPNSSCTQRLSPNCRAELIALSQDKAKFQAIQEQAKQLMISLKVAN